MDGDNGWLSQAYDDRAWGFKKDAGRSMLEPTPSRADVALGICSAEQSIAAHPSWPTSRPIVLPSASK